MLGKVFDFQDVTSILYILFTLFAGVVVQAVIHVSTWEAEERGWPQGGSQQVSSKQNCNVYLDSVMHCSKRFL